MPEVAVRALASEENAVAYAHQWLPKWESRRETRFSPASFASGGPELPGDFPARLRTGGEGRERRLFARMSTSREAR